MDCSLPGSSVHGILQTRILELAFSKWVAISFSNDTIYNVTKMLCFAEYKLLTQLLQESMYMNMCVHVYFYNYI